MDGAAGAVDAPTTDDVALSRRERALKQAEQVETPAHDGRTRHNLAPGEDWHAMPAGGEVAVCIDEQGREYIAELSASGRNRRRVSVLGVTVLLDAGRL
jgi:hypothetical protein